MATASLLEFFKKLNCYHKIDFAICIFQSSFYTSDPFGLGGWYSDFIGKRKPFSVVGPAIAYLLIKVIPLRSIFLFALLSSILAFLVITLFVKGVKKNSNSSNELLISIKNWLNSITLHLPRLQKIHLAFIFHSCVVMYNCNTLVF
jgi:hypothetical protein